MVSARTKRVLCSGTISPSYPRVQRRTFGFQSIRYYAKGFVIRVSIVGFRIRLLVRGILGRVSLVSRNFSISHFVFFHEWPRVCNDLVRFKWDLRHVHKLFQLYS